MLCPPPFIIAHYIRYKKAETYQHAGGVPTVHGDSGPLKISLAEDEINIATQFLDVAAEYDKERGYTDDVNDFSTCNVYGVGYCLLL